MNTGYYDNQVLKQSTILENMGEDSENSVRPANMRLLELSSGYANDSLSLAF